MWTSEYGGDGVHRDTAGQPRLSRAGLSTALRKAGCNELYLLSMAV